VGLCRRVDLVLAGRVKGRHKCLGVLSVGVAGLPIQVAIAAVGAAAAVAAGAIREARRQNAPERAGMRCCWDGRPQRRWRRLGATLRTRSP
jgi:hypothetical protein